MQLPFTKIDPFYAAQNGFSSAELDRIIEIGKTAPEVESQLVAGESNLETRTCKLSWMHKTEQTDWIIDTVIAALTMLNKNNYNYDLDQIEPLQFTQYDAGRSEFYGAHIDCAWGINSQVTSRKLSLVLQLSDPADYEGGDLLLHCGYDAPIKAPKERGSVIVFPSFMLHEVTPVTAGQRYSLVTWAHGPSFR